MADLKLTPKEAHFLCEAFWKLGYDRRYVHTYEDLYDDAQKAHPKDPQAGQFMDNLAIKLNEYFSGETGTITVQQPAFEDKQ